MNEALEDAHDASVVDAIHAGGKRRASTSAPPRSLLRGSLLLLIALGGLFLLGYLPRRAERERLLAGVTDQGPERVSVSVVKPKVAPAERVLKLPATLAPNEQAVVYARANGYVQRWLVELGDAVHAGQLLAQLDTPELDRELLEARAGVAQSEASISLARAARDFTSQTLARHQQLSEKRLTSKQELAQHQAASSVDHAKVQVAEAERTSRIARLQRLEQLKGFAKVHAPFAGTITSRTIERGSLVTAGTSSPLFEIASLDPLRVDVHVPQSQSADISRGRAAKLSVPEHPGRAFEARVARTGGRLDPKTRTLRVELEVRNDAGLLLPGMYVTVELPLSGTRERLLIPASALLGGKEGTRVARVGADGRVQSTRVEVERDLGSEVEIASGLSSTDDVVSNPPPGLVDGTSVQVSASASARAQRP